MSASWDQLWSEFAAAVERLNAAVHPESRGYLPKLERSANDAFALRALVSYSPIAAPGDERLVISLDVSREGPDVIGYMDVARGDGFVLAEEEVVHRISEAELAGSPAVLDGATEALASFVEQQYDTLVLELGHEQ